MSRSSGRRLELRPSSLDRLRHQVGGTVAVGDLVQALVERHPALRDRFGEHEREHLLAMPRHRAERQVGQPVQALLALVSRGALAHRIRQRVGRARRFIVERECGDADEQVDRTRHLREHDGIDFAELAMGLYGIAEVLRNLDNPESRDVVRAAIGRLLPTAADLRQCVAPVLRGTAIGSVLGILPGNGAVLGPFAAYTVEKRIARDPSRFGRGAIEGVAGPESANNAGAQTSFIPMLTLGLPSNAVMALMIGALTIHDIQPGPQVMEANPALFWGLVASMWIGNLLLVILNLPLIGIWIRLLSLEYRLLYPCVIVLCCIGVYSVSNSVFLVTATAAFGALGYVFTKLECEPAPLLLGFVLGPLMEENLRRAMTMSGGDGTVFLTRPVSLVLLLAAVGLLLMILSPTLARRREEAFQEEAG